MKKVISIFLFGAIAFNTFAIEYHVSPTAHKNGNGTLSSPFNTIQVAKQKVARVNKNMSEDIIVYLHGGTYNLEAPLVFKEKDSGTNGHTIIYKAYQNETPLISGGIKVQNWEHVSGNIYKAQLNRDAKLRTLFVNGKRKRMAGTEVPVKGIGKWGEYEVKGTESWAYDSGTAIDGIMFRTADVRSYRNPEDVELVQNNVWTEKILCIREAQQVGDTTILKLQQPYGAIATSMAWAGKIKYHKEFVIRNAYELLDRPGEFYFDKQKKELYYYSDGEDMTTVEVMAPAADGLIVIEGTSTTSRVENLQFEGISFSYDHWQLMDIEGSHAFAGVQSTGMAIQYVSDGNWHPTEYNCVGVPRGTIQVANAENISLVSNRFERLSSGMAINMVNDVKNSVVTGNFFHDLLGNSINIGHPQHYKIGDGQGVYSPEVEGLCENIGVTNNYIRNVSLDFRQLEGITAFFVADVKIDHNDIAGMPYGAITIGWWWGNSGLPPSKVAKNNSMSFNKAGKTHLALKDGGIIYALGEQPNSVMEGNYLYKGRRCIYPDDGSAYWTIKRNVVDNRIPKIKSIFWLHIWRDNCHDNVVQDNYVKSNNIKDNGKNTIIENTHHFMTSDFSIEAKNIMKAAGIQDEYKNIVPQKEPIKISLYPEDFKDTDH
ncbi:hypothetical protein [Reichenbachiella versicolor]|uniref:hypothetical protein n=1 Tax=Reichenbachiella versicolor TaxID=1821036 RepID=UPI000D6DEBE2|nr:hypothetical protein [Reichenbachiella versicolor]